MCTRLPRCGVHYFLQKMAAFHQWTLAQVLAFIFQQVVGEQDNRKGRPHPGVHCLAPEPALQLRKRQRGLAAPCENLPVEHGAIGQGGRGLCDFREAAGDDFFAAGPDEHFTPAPDQLRADAIPFPFGLPLVRFPRAAGSSLQRRGEERKDRAAPLRRRPDRSREDALEILRRGLPASQAGDAP